MADILKSVHLPTLDRPFGIELWPYFSTAYSKLMGFPPTKFVFVPGVTPLSTLSACATMLITYYVTIFAGREFMRNREPFKLNGLFMLHNLYLTLISGVLLALFVEQLLSTIWRNGIFYAICDYRGGWTAPLVTLYYVHSSPFEGICALTDKCAAQLPHEISGTSRHHIHGLKKETSDLPPHISSRRHGPSLLHATDWPHFCLLGTNNTEPSRSCRYVLVLLSSRAWRPHLVEEMDHQAADHSIHYRPWLCLLCFLYIFRFYVLPQHPISWLLRWRGIRGICWHGHPELISTAVHQLLPRHL